MIHVNLQGVPQTLLVPLVGRAVLSKQNSPLFYDDQALKLVAQLDYDFESLIKTCGSLFLWILARAYQSDNFIKAYLAKHPKAVVIDLGAGLETAFYRVDNQQLTWVDIDLAEVVTLKEQLLPKQERLHYIAKSVFDYSWIDYVKTLGNDFVFISGGVFMYFTKEQVKELLNKINDNFPNSQIMFDFKSEKTVKYANKKLKASNMTAKMTFALNNVKDVLNMLPNTAQAIKRSYFNGLITKLDLPLLTKLKLYFVNVFDKGGLAIIKFKI